MSGDSSAALPSNIVYSPLPDESGEHEVEDVLDTCASRSGVREFRVLCKGYSLF